MDTAATLRRRLRLAERAGTRSSPEQGEEAGPFDIVGDIHGCAATLAELLEALGYERGEGRAWTHAERRLVFVGDYINRGPAPGGVLMMVKAIVEAGTAIALAGNHEEMLLGAIEGQAEMLDTAEGHWLQSAGGGYWHLSNEMRVWLGTLTAHVRLDGGRLVVSHAGLRRDRVGRMDQSTHNEAMWGPDAPTWRDGWDNEPTLHVHGHYAGHGEVKRTGAVICVDARCGFPGGRLACYRYPEGRVVSVAMNIHEDIHVSEAAGDKAHAAKLREGR